jgi:histone arginine demethylase JMJD6
MSGFQIQEDFKLIASTELGTFRQLFSDDDEVKPKTFELRPNGTRSQMGLANMLQTKDMQSLLHNEHQQPHRIDNFATSSTTFNKTYPSDRDFVPLVITNCDDGGTTRPKMEWALPTLTNILGKSRRLEVAQEDATVSLQEYLSYLGSTGVQSDDNPVLIFETLVDGEHDCIIDRFSIPRPFWGGPGRGEARSGCHTAADRSDLLSAAGDNGLAFGLHRWMILGPQNSGSNLHIDPLGTSAWNMLLIGRKLWVLFPPHTQESALKSAQRMAMTRSSDEEKAAGEREGDYCAAGWFVNQLPNIKKEIMDPRVHFVQQPGETVFVPEGWWHAVLNLDTTFAVTQNFGHPHSFEKVAAALDEACHKSAKAWRRNIKRTTWPAAAVGESILQGV